MDSSDSNPDRDAIRRGIEAQLCPWCGKGPYAMLAVHTNKIHDVDKWMLRELAGLTTRDPLCAPEVSEKMAEANRQNPHLEKMHAVAKTRGPKRWTSAGIEKNKTTIVEWTKANPDAHREASSTGSQHLTAEGKERRSAAARAAGLARAAELRVLAPQWMQTPEAQAKRAETRAKNARPCGTRAAYRRGCRCDKCREAYLAYRREHG